MALVNGKGEGQASPCGGREPSKKGRYTMAILAAPQRKTELAKKLIESTRFAPSSHNTQPWKFIVDDDGMDVVLDPDRRLMVSDPDGREHFISLGCVLETLLLTARKEGLTPSLKILPCGESPDFAARLEWNDTGGFHNHIDPLLARMMENRHTAHGPFHPTEVNDLDRSRLETALQYADVRPVWVDATSRRYALAEALHTATLVQFEQPEFRHELAHWLRHGLSRTGTLATQAATVAIENFPIGPYIAKHDRDLLFDAPHVIALVTPHDGLMSRVHTGMAMMRLWLRATELGLLIQPMNAALQVPELKREVREILGLESGEAPQFIFRMGYGLPDRAHTPRRPLDEMIVWR